MTAAYAFALLLGLAALAPQDRVSLLVRRGDQTAACGDDEALRDAVRRRMGSEPFVEGAADARRQLRVTIERKDAATIEARVALFDAAGVRLGHRALRGPADCVALSNDLALAIAIAIDPLLLLRAAIAGEAVDAAPGGEPAVDARAPDPSTRAPAPRAQELSIGRAPDPMPTGLPFELPSPQAISARALAGFAAGVGAAVVPSLRAELALDYGAAELDVGVRIDLPSRVPVDARTSIDLTLITLVGGPCALLTLPALGGRACATVQVGELAAIGSGFVSSPSSTTPWLAAGGSVSGELALTETLRATVLCELHAPLVRARFVDAVTGQTLAEPQRAVAALGAGVSYAFR